LRQCPVAFILFIEQIPRISCKASHLNIGNATMNGKEKLPALKELHLKEERLDCKPGTQVIVVKRSLELFK
jgi:hypothetical protein